MGRINWRRVAVMVLIACCGCGPGNHWRAVTPLETDHMKPLGLSAQDREQLLGYESGGPTREALLAALPARVGIVQVRADASRAHGDDMSPEAVVYVRSSDQIMRRRHLERLTALPMIIEAVPFDVRAIDIGQPVHGSRALREAAARQGIDLLLVYAFNATTKSGSAVDPLNVLTLGVLPTYLSEGTARVQAVLMDVPTGDIFAFASTDVDAGRLANFWTQGEARDGARLDAERAAFDTLLEAFDRQWRELVHAGG